MPALPGLQHRLRENAFESTQLLARVLLRRRHGRSPEIPVHPHSGPTKSRREALVMRIPEQQGGT
jgi:hypothetical protein